MRSAPTALAEKYSAAPAQAAKKMLAIEMALGETRILTRTCASRLAQAACRVFRGLLAVSVSIRYGVRILLL
jgi:hypothetical protein